MPELIEDGRIQAVKGSKGTLVLQSVKDRAKPTAYIMVNLEIMLLLFEISIA